MPSRSRDNHMAHSMRRLGAPALCGSLTDSQSGLSFEPLLLAHCRARRVPQGQGLCSLRFLCREKQPASAEISWAKAGYRLHEISLAEAGYTYRLKDARLIFLEFCTLWAY